MAKNTDRLQVTLDVKTLEFLKVLGSKGTHGKDDVAAARTLIEQGIRQAIQDGFLTAAPKRIRRVKLFGGGELNRPLSHRPHHRESAPNSRHDRATGFGLRGGCLQAKRLLFGGLNRATSKRHCIFNSGIVAIASPQENNRGNNNRPSNPHESAFVAVAQAR